jgi:hypothetical protein
MVQTLPLHLEVKMIVNAHITSKKVYQQIHYGFTLHQDKLGDLTLLSDRSATPYNPIGGDDCSMTIVQQPGR